MTLYTYTGKVTDFSRSPMPTADGLGLWVVPTRPAMSASGVMWEKAIPVTVAANGDFSVKLEASSQVRPAGLIYKLHARWLHSNQPPPGWSDIHFLARRGGGNIGDMLASNISMDTDDVPYFDPGSFDTQVLTDTDGVFYVKVGG